MARSGAGLGPGLVRVIGRTRPWPGLAWGEPHGVPQHSSVDPPNTINHRGAWGMQGPLPKSSHTATRRLPHGKAPPGRPVWVPGWLPWAGLSTWRPCASRAAVGARTPDQPTHRGRRGYMSAQGVSPGRSTVSIASKRDGSGQSVALASSDRQGLSGGRHPLR